MARALLGRPALSAKVRLDVARVSARRGIRVSVGARYAAVAIRGILAPAELGQQRGPLP